MHTESSYQVTYTFRALDGALTPRRTGPFARETATALAKDLARRDNIQDVAIEEWRCMSTEEVVA